MIVLHVERKDRQNVAWCGANITGPRVIGVDGVLHHTERAGTAPCCPPCLEKILNTFAVAVRKSQGVE
jgi:hypothetical protein